LIVPHRPASGDRAAARRSSSSSSLGGGGGGGCGEWQALRETSSSGSSGMAAVSSLIYIYIYIHSSIRITLWAVYHAPVGIERLVCVFFTSCVPSMGAAHPNLVANCSPRGKQSILISSYPIPYPTLISLGHPHQPSKTTAHSHLHLGISIQRSHLARPRLSGYTAIGFLRTPIQWPRLDRSLPL